MTVISKEKLDFGATFVFCPIVEWQWELWERVTCCPLSIQGRKSFIADEKPGKKFDGEEEERKDHCGDQRRGNRKRRRVDLSTWVVMLCYEGQRREH